MNANAKKSLKIIALLATSLLISFVSAETYTELFMNGTPITIGSAGVKFTTGTNTTTMGGGDAINTQGTEVTFDAIPAIEPGQTITYDQAVNITNNSGATKTLNVSLYSLTGTFSTNFDYVNITVLNAAGVTQGSNIELVGTGSNTTSTGSLSISNGDIWIVRWIIKTRTDATDGQSINLTLKVKVE